MGAADAVDQPEGVGLRRALLRPLTPGVRAVVDWVTVLGRAPARGSDSDSDSDSDSGSDSGSDSDSDSDSDSA